GIEQGTVITSANGKTITSEQQLIDFTKSHAGQRVILELKRGASIETTQVTLNKTSGNSGYLGVIPLKTSSQRYGCWSPVVAAGIMLQLIWRTLAGLGPLFIGLPALIRGFSHAQPVTANVAGPIGIVEILSSIWHLGWTYIWVFIFTISLSLGVINALPIP